MLSVNDIKNHLLRGGLTTEEYDAIRPAIYRTNRVPYIGVTAILLVIFTALCANPSVNGDMVPQWAYFLLDGLLLALLGVEELCFKKSPAIVLPLAYAMVAMAFAYCTYLGTTNSMESISGAILIVIVAAPLILLDRPIRNITLTIVASLCFIVSSFHFKNYDIAIYDAINATIACAVGCFLSAQGSSVRIQNLSFGYRSDVARKTDGLTGLTNKSSFATQVQTALSAGEGTLLIIDADNFKRVNDTYGHDEGDRVLKEMANVIRQTFRSTDVIGRFGGDEFVVYMVGCVDRDVAAERAARLVARMSQEVLLGGGVDHMNISVGVAPSTLLNEGETKRYDALFKQADLALYESKGKGKNQVTFA